MITRPESCVKEERKEAAPAAGKVWDVLVACGILLYLVLTLFSDWESPVLTIGMMVVTGYALIRPHLRARHRQR